MIKVIFLFKFRSDIDPGEVRRWWLNEHGALALKNLAMKRYVQNHFITAIDVPQSKARLAFDGCVEVWFDDQEAFERTMASPEWKAGNHDAANGLDVTSFMGGVVEEHVLRWDDS